MKKKKNSKERAPKQQRDTFPPLSHDEVVLNKCGQCDAIPRGWIQTLAPKASLERTGIKCVEVDIGRKNYTKLVRAFHPCDRKRVYQRERSGSIIPLIEEVQLTKLGNSKGIPYRWVQTKLTQTQLKKLKVPYVTAVVSFTKYGPVIGRCIHPKYEKVTLEYQPARRRK